MAFMAASQMCCGVVKSGSPTLKSYTFLPAAFSSRAFAAMANVAEGSRACTIFEMLTDMTDFSKRGRWRFCDTLSGERDPQNRTFGWQRQGARGRFPKGRPAV